MMSALQTCSLPGMQGGPLEHIIAAKAVSFTRRGPEYKTYQAQVKKNAAVMSRRSSTRYNVVSGYDNHCILVDLRSKFPDLTGKVAEKLLVEADITTNKNMVPFDSRSPFQTSGLRFGTPAITTRGGKEELMEEIVEMIDMVLADESKIAVVRNRVNSTMRHYPLFAW